MTDWRPSSGPAAAQQRAAMLRRLRDFFDATGVLEVDTPSLSTSAVSDVQIESIEAKSRLTDATLYLHTSPEFCMKRLLAAGYPDIYSISRVFRDGELGRKHQPEFTMVEWYRLGFELNDMVENTVAGIATALDDARLIDNVEIVEYRSAFLDVAGVDPLDATIDELANAAGADVDLRQSLGDERDDWLDLILTTRIAPAFSTKNLTVLQHYPASQAALARCCPNDASVADRFEIFMGITELANGYVELTDGNIQAERILNDQASRASRDLPRRPVDRALLDALDAGLPACAGVAMGLERLQMIYGNCDDIRDVITFAFEKYDD